MNKKIIIESLAMDLKRTALGLHRGSLFMAQRFREEALKREKELEGQKTDGYLKILLSNTKKILKSYNKKDAEDILMYSTLFQNYSQRKFK